MSNLKHLQSQQKQAAPKFIFPIMGGYGEIYFEEGVRNTEHLFLSLKKEASRIESKFNFYSSDSDLSLLNRKRELDLSADEEFCRLLDYANYCYQYSEGLIDITVGSFRNVWRFSEASKLPSREQIKLALNNIGWEKVDWVKPNIKLNFETIIDFGGIVKEYAVDRLAMMASEMTKSGFLINLGGDIFAAAKKNGTPWKIGIENPADHLEIVDSFSLYRGAVATSGNGKRFINSGDGQVYAHIINPITGYPVKSHYSSVSVFGSSCTEAGIHATLAFLKEGQGEAYLKQKGLKYYYKSLANGHGGKDT